MGYFEDEHEVYKYVGGAFRMGGTHPQAGPKLRAANLVLKMHLSEPTSEMTVKFADDYQVIEGPSDLAPDIELFMPADLADKYWRGEYNIAMGLAKGQVQSKGSINKLLKLVPLTKPLMPMYRELTAEKDGVTT